MKVNEIKNLLDSIKTRNKKIYIMGCGGISMTIISDFLLKNSYDLMGVDINLKKIVHADQYCQLFDNHNGDNINDCGALIVSHFFTDGDYPEIIKAKNENIPIILRIDFLNYMAQTVKNNHNLMGVIGSSGKTTTTYFGFCLSKLLGNNPSIFGGSYLPMVGNNYFLGNHDVFFENDESRTEHLNIKSDWLMVTSLFPDHLEEKCYENKFEKLQESLLQQINQSVNVIYYSDGGILDELINKSNKTLDINCFSYSEVNPNAHCFIKEFSSTHLGSMGHVIIKKNNKIYNLHLTVPFFGIKNFINYCANVFYQINEKNYKKIIDISRFVYMASERYTFCGEINNVIIINNFGQILEEFLTTVKSYKQLYPQRKLYLAIEITRLARYNREILRLESLIKEVDGIFMAPAIENGVYYNLNHPQINKSPRMDKIFYCNTIQDFHNNLENFIEQNQESSVLICSHYTKPYGLNLLQNLSYVTHH
jgi:UDP-N-acetylmuramate--alanine ligase